MRDQPTPTPRSRSGQALPKSGKSAELPSSPPQPSGGSNRLLYLLPADEATWAWSHLERVPARAGAVLAEPGEPLSHVYFPESCAASLVNPTSEGVVEVGTVGNEGMVGLSSFLGGEAIPSRILWQISGTAQRMPASVFSDGVETRPTCRRIVLRYAHAFFVQVSQTAACNRVHDIERRCARWLLMTHDRVGGADSFELTHVFLAFMLGVRRAGVTEAAGALQDRGLIRYTRGKITIIDRAGLEDAACECYRVVRAHFERFIGTPA